jgi:Cof subfamily protein (haloacid dehalogenase superfamily)
VEDGGVEKPLLIASDIDGTLLTTENELSPRTVSAIGRILASDIPFVLVSGRPPRWIPPVAELAGLSGYAVCANGAIIYDIAASEVVSVHGLDPMLLHDVAHTLQSVLTDTHLATEWAVVGPYDGGVTFATEPGFRNPWGDAETNYRPRAEVLGKPATKLLVRHEKMTSTEMALAARELLGDAVDVTFSTNSGLIEISAPGVTKALGLAEVADRAGVAQQAVVAFGDMPNDIEMLRWAGHGVAMANAHASVLEAADEVTAAHDEDGVALVLERWF